MRTVKHQNKCQQASTAAVVRPPTLSKDSGLRQSVQECRPFANHRRKCASVEGVAGTSSQNASSVKAAGDDAARDARQVLCLHVSEVDGGHFGCRLPAYHEEARHLRRQEE